jgi:hypothetical protein
VISCAPRAYLHRRRNTADGLVEDEVGVLLVDGVVGQMHELIV